MAQTHGDRGAPPPRPANTNHLTSDDTPSHSPTSMLPAGRTYAMPPCRGRRLWLAVVLTCPWCGTGHSHRAFEAARLLAGRLVKTCPVTGRPYALAPVQRRKEARRAA